MGTVQGHSLNMLFLYRTVNHYFSSKSYLSMLSMLFLYSTVNHYFSSKSYLSMLHKVHFYHAVEIRKKIYRQALVISNTCFSKEH